MAQMCNQSELVPLRPVGDRENGRITSRTPARSRNLYNIQFVMNPKIRAWMTEIQTKGENGVKCGQDDRTMRYRPGIMRAKQGGKIGYHKLHAWRHGNGVTWRLWGNGR